MGILESDLVMPIKVRNDDNYLKIDKLRNSGWEYLGIPGNTWEYLGIPGNTYLVSPNLFPFSDFVLPV